MEDNRPEEDTLAEEDSLVGEDILAEEDSPEEGNLAVEDSLVGEDIHLEEDSPEVGNLAVEDSLAEVDSPVERGKPAGEDSPEGGSLEEGIVQEELSIHRKEDNLEEEIRMVDIVVGVEGDLVQVELAGEVHSELVVGVGPMLQKLARAVHLQEVKRWIV